MNVLESIKKYYDAQKQMIDAANELQRETGIMVCGLPEPGVFLFEGIEKLEELPGAVTNVEKGERFKRLIRKTVKVDGIVIYQLGWYGEEGLQFEKAVVR
jgi:hypothetical protein